MNNILNRTKYVIKGEEGDLNLQALGLIAVALFIMGALFLFRDSVATFIEETSEKVGDIQKDALDAYDAGQKGGFSKN